MKLWLILMLGIVVLLPTASSHAGWVRADGLDNYGTSLVLAAKDNKYQNKHEKKQAKKQRKRENEDNNATAAKSPPPPSDTSGQMNDNVLWGDYQYTNPPKQ